MPTIGRADIEVHYIGRDLPREARALGEEAGGGAGEEFGDSFDREAKGHFDDTAKDLEKRSGTAGEKSGDAYGGRFGMGVRRASKRDLEKFANDISKLGADTGGIDRFDGKLAELRTSLDEGARSTRTAEQQLGDYLDRLGVSGPEAEALRNLGDAHLSFGQDAERGGAAADRGEGGFRRLFGTLKGSGGIEDGFRGAARGARDLTAEVDRLTPSLDRASGRGNILSRTADAIGEAYTRAKGSLSGFDPFDEPTQLIALIVTLLPALATLSVGAAGGLVVLGGALGAALAGTGLLVAGFSNLFGKLEDVDARVRPFAAAVRGLGDDLQGLRAQLQISMFRGLTDDVENLTRTLFPTIKHTACDCPQERGRRVHSADCIHVPVVDAQGRPKRRCRCPYRWSAEIVVKGKRRQAAGSGHRTAAEANRARLAALEELRKTPAERSRGTIGDGITAWLDRREKSGAIRLSTALAYRQHVTTYIVPLPGDVKLRDLDADDVERFQAELHEQYAHLTDATRQRIGATLRAYLRKCERKRLIGVDPTRHAEPVRATAPRVKPWQPEQIGRFLDWAASTEQRLGPLVEVAIATGMRRGELCGLRWVDVDLARKRIVVAQQVQRLQRQTLIGKPKTKAGEDRVVDLGTDTVEVLRRVLEQQDRERAEWGDDYAEHGLVFTWQDGRPLSPEDLTRRFPKLVTAFNTDAERVGAVLPHLTFHGLRHVAASLLLNSGTSLPVLSKMFGHSSVVITSDLYGHLLDDIGQAAAERAAASIPRSGRPDPVRTLSRGQ